MGTAMYCVPSTTYVIGEPVALPGNGTLAMSSPVAAS
jgi:hypothetical protein